MPAGAVMAASSVPGWAVLSREEKTAQLRLLKEDIIEQCKTQITDQADTLCLNVDRIIDGMIQQLPKKFRDITINEAFQVSTVEDPARGVQALGTGPSASSKGAGPKRVRDGQTQTVLYARKKVKSAGGLPSELEDENQNHNQPILDRPTPLKATSPAKTGLVNLTPLRGAAGGGGGSKSRPAANVTSDGATGGGDDAQHSGLGAAGRGGSRQSILEVPMGHRFDSLDQKERKELLAKLGSVLQDLVSRSQ